MHLSYSNPFHLWVAGRRWPWDGDSAARQPSPLADVPATQQCKQNLRTIVQPASAANKRQSDLGRM